MLKSYAHRLPLQFGCKLLNSRDLPKTVVAKDARFRAMPVNGHCDAKSRRTIEYAGSERVLSSGRSLESISLPLRRGVPWREGALDEELISSGEPRNSSSAGVTRVARAAEMIYDPWTIMV